MTRPFVLVCAVWLAAAPAAAGTNDLSSTNDRIIASFDPLDNLNPFSTLIPVTRVEGITRAVVAPAPGTFFIAGRGLLLELGSLDAAVTVDRNPVALYASIGEAGAALRRPSPSRTPRACTRRGSWSCWRASSRTIRAT
jgi:hypothetical protein